MASKGSEAEPLKGVTAVILVGGESKRMGRDKSLVELGGVTLAERVFDIIGPLFDEVIISARSIDYSAPRGLSAIKVITDNDDEQRGPAVGLRAALREAATEWIFLLSCDLPLLSTDVIRHLASLREGFDCIVPVVGDRLQPTCALYAKSCLAPLSARLKEGRAGIISLLNNERSLRVRRVSEDELKGLDPKLKCFIDVDTPEELERIKELIASEEND